LNIQVNTTSHAIDFEGTTISVSEFIFPIELILIVSHNTNSRPNKSKSISPEKD